MSPVPSAARRAVLPLAAAALGAVVLLGELPDGRGGGDGGGTPMAAPPRSAAEVPRTASVEEFCEASRYFTASHLDQLNNPDRPAATGLERAAARLVDTGLPPEAPDRAAQGLLVVVEDALAPWQGGAEAPPASAERNRDAGAFNRYAERTCPDAF